MDNCNIIEVPIEPDDEVHTLNEEQAKTPKKKRKPISAEAKKQMLENLAKAREVAKQNREAKNGNPKARKPKREPEPDYSEEEDEPLPKPKTKSKVKPAKIKTKYRSPSPIRKSKYDYSSESDYSSDDEPETPPKKKKPAKVSAAKLEKQRRLEQVESKLDKILKKISKKELPAEPSRVITHPTPYVEPKAKPQSTHMASKLLSMF